MFTSSAGAGLVYAARDGRGVLVERPPCED
jgi:hypothetical protein